MVTDEDLFRAWQHGDTGALETLAQRYHAPLLAHLHRVLTDTHLAEDLVQETFLRLIRDVQSYQYPRPFRPWLYAIAHHLTSHYHTSAYARRVELRAELPATLAREPDPAEWFERWERPHHLHKALRYLSIEQREVLSLRFGQELSIQETSAILSIPPGTVKSRTFTASALAAYSLGGGSRQNGESTRRSTSWITICSINFQCRAMNFLLICGIRLEAMLPSRFHVHLLPIRHT